MSETVASGETQAVAGTEKPNDALVRRADLLWCAALIIAVIGILFGTFAEGLLVRSLGILALGLAALAFALVLGKRRRISAGAAVTTVVALFTAVVAGRPSTPALLALKDAPRYKEVDALGPGEPGKVQALEAAPREVMSHPGPIALTGFGLPALSGGQLLPGVLVAAEWDGSWFAGRVLGVSGDEARVHFIGWESEWDEGIPRGHLRSIGAAQLPRLSATSSVNTLGGTTPGPNAMIVSVFQPPGGLQDGADLKALKPSATLYPTRLDVSDAPLAQAMNGFSPDPSKTLAVAAEAALRFDRAGKYYFAVTADGATQLWMDDSPVAPGTPLDLESGVHQLRLEYRHPPGPKLTLGLRSGTDPKALRVVDMNRQGVAQAAREPNGGVRLVLPEGVLFELDKDELNPSAERALSAIFAVNIAPAPNAPVKVEGHTDDSGSDEHNLDLSKRRADRVRAWLLARGLSENGVTSEAFGEKRPRVPNDSAEHRRQNRRVELIVGGGPPSAGSPATAPPTSTNGTAGAAPPQAVADLLRRYYRELNEGKFEANHYFEPSVERYITMMNTSTSAMNDYIWKVFPKQFKQHHFELEEGTLASENAQQYVYVEHSRYVMAGKTQSVEKRVKVRVRLSPAGKLVFLHQFQRL